jgi:hypothetical protein
LCPFLGSKEEKMFRMLYRVGLLLAATILVLFMGARLVYFFDPYRVLTEALIHQVAAEPQRTVRLNRYGSLADELRHSLYTEEVSTFALWLEQTNVTTLLDWIPFRPDAKFLVAGVDTAVHKIAALDADLASAQAAESLSRDLAQLRFYHLDRGDAVLSGLYRQSTAVSDTLSTMSDGLGEVATAVNAVTTFPAVETIQQEIHNAKESATRIAAGDTPLFSWIIPAEAADQFVRLADFVYWSIESWQGLPANMWATRQQIDADVIWLDDFEQQYRTAKAFNDKWHFDTLRGLPRFVAEFHQPLLLGVVGSLLLAIGGWFGSLAPAPQPQPARPARPHRSLPAAPKPTPRLAFCWPDGRRECQTLPAVGELTIGNIIIRRARVRYYLERIDHAFPAFLNGQSVGKAHILQDGDVLQIGELQTIFQLAA